MLADSRFTGEAPVHQETYDWLQPGGLLRPVEAHILPQPTQHIAHVSVVPSKDSGRRGNVQVTLKLSEGCGPGMTAKIRFDDHHLLATERNVGKTTQWTEQVPEAKLWTPSEPQLHVLTLSLFSLEGVQVDAVSVRFGLRTVESTEGQIRINGEPLLLLGVNRHESHPFGGIFMTLDALRRDIELLKELGANFVRGSHYSQDQRFLDLCDENGLLVWEETVAWQPSLEDLQDPIFMSQQLQALDETIDASVNHPSVIIWGFLNEGEANVRAAREAYQQLAKFTKLKDPSRLVSWASRHKVRDETLDLADVIAFNDYPGWYDALVPDIPAVWQSYADWVRVHHPGKAVLIAEAGASGLANFLRPANSSGAGLEMWSEDLQAAIVGATIASAVAAGYAGVALWQFADSRVDVALLEEDNQRRQKLPVPILEVGAGSAWVEQVAVGYQITNSPFGHHMALRPRGLNNKGLLSLSRQHRKLAFEVAKEGFRGFCFPIVPGRPLEPSTPTAVVEIESLEPNDAMQSHAGCTGCILAAHTWNPADRPPGEPGLRVHGHRLASRAARFVLKAGLLSLAGHSDGRLAAVGGFVTVAGTRDVASSYVAVREAPTSLWRFEMQDDPNVFLLRVIAGKRCGGVLSLDAGRIPEDLRDGNSVYAVVHMDASLATLFKMRVIV